MAAENDEDLVDFINECRELIDEVAATLVEKKGRLCHESINALYRSLHTIKGSAQLFGFQQLSALTQTMEGALEPIRDNTLAIPAELPPHMVKATDVVSHILDAIEQQGDLAGFDAVVEDLVLEGTAIMVVACNVGFVAALGSTPAPSTFCSSPAALQKDSQDLGNDAIDDADQAAAIKEASTQNAPAPEAEIQDAVAQQQAAEPAKQYEPGDTSSRTSDSIRVQVSLLDHFMNLVGELVLTKNQVVDLARNEQSLKLRELSRDIAHVTSELQFVAMKTRLQPVGNVLTKFHRVVREIANDLGKTVEFSLTGAQTELDRTLVEAIKDPITHIVRNALDHGIEMPEERLASGKTEPACLKIQAYYENGQVVVAIEDNGKGLNIDAIRKKVIEKGLLPSVEAEMASDGDIVPFIFEPGFSTSDAVSELSGRGVGMDVVKNNIEAIGGRVDVETKAGQGTTFKLRIPLTMAIVSVMVVMVGGRPFAIPGANIQEMLKVQLDSPNAVEEVGGVPVYKLRGRLLPIVRLDRLLELSVPDTERGPIDGVIVVNTGTTVFGLAVDAIVESLEVVVKPLHPAIKQRGHFSGAAVLGDGKIALTLDITGLAGYAAIDGLAIETEAQAEAKANKDQGMEFLIVRMSPKRRIAIPIDRIYRLEKIVAADLSFVSNVASYTYGQRRIRIFDIRDDLGLAVTPWQRSECEVVMCKSNGGHFGLAVDRIEDIHTTTEGFDSGWFDVPGVIGNLIIAEETVVVVAPAELRSVQNHSSLAFVTQNSISQASSSQQMKVLLVEDSQFFRNQVRKVLQEEGFDCVVAEDGVEAMALLSSGRHDPFDVIISDIEMPRMDGLALAKAVRQDAYWQRTPLIALTTRFRKKDQEAGLAAGFNEYLEKLNAKVLVAKLRAYSPSSGDRSHAS